MDELVERISAIARGMWRRRWIGVAVAWLVGCAGAVFVMHYPDRYEAVARLYVDTKTVLRPLLRDLAIDPDTDLSAAMLSKTLITRPNVEQLVHKLKLDADAKDQAARDGKIQHVLTSIKIASLGRDNIYDFAYRDVNGDRARDVVQGFVSMFLDIDAQARHRDTKAARDFIDGQVKEYEARLAEAESKLKDFRMRNLGISGASGRDYFTRISTLEEELSKATIELRAAEQSRDALRRELGGEMPPQLLDTTTSEGGGVSAEFDARLDTQRKQLDELLRRYTELHPDVVATRRLISRLEEQKAAELEAKRRAANGKPARSTTAVDPVYQRVKLALAEAEANVASLRFRVGDTQVRLNQLRALASRVPQVEAELAQLTRDHELVKRNYEAMVSRREKATLSEDLDANRQAQFRLIDPPRTGKEPIFPSRLTLAPLVLLLSIVAGLAASAMADRLLPTFDSAKGLRLATNRPVLGSVSALVSAGAQRRARNMTMAFGSSVAVLLLFGLAWIRWLTAASIHM